MGKLNFLGIGPKIGIVLVPWLTAAIILSCIKNNLFVYTSGNRDFLLITGIVVIVAGFVFYISTVRLLLRGLKETRLMTKGAYYLCQNPLYASIMLLIIPALSFILNSWLIVTSSVAGYMIFKIFIRSEYKELEKIFGADYLKYKNETPEFFPLPLKKWFP